MTNVRNRVVIVGAGMAGLTAGRRLQAAGYAVLLVDKGRAPGGRIATRRVTCDDADRKEHASMSFDHGAQYFTVRDAAFVEEVNTWSGAGVVRPWKARLASFDSEGREALKSAVDRWVGVPGMSAIGRHLADGLDVRNSVRVSALSRTPSGWHAAVEHGEPLGPFDLAVVAVPAPQAVALLSESPVLASAAASVRMHPCWAVMVTFDEPVAAPFDGAFVSSSPLGWIARDRSKPKRGRAETWVLHAGPEWSAAHVDDPADAVGPFLLNAFADLVRGTLPKPHHVSAHRWRFAAAELPFTRGAFYDNGKGLGLCGDWCAGNRIEDAFRSGAKLAQLVVNERGGALVARWR